MSNDSPDKPTVELVPVEGGTAPAAVTNLVAALNNLFNPPRPGTDEYIGPLAVRKNHRPVLVPIPAGSNPEEELAKIRERLAYPVPDTVNVIMSTSGSTTGIGSLVGLSTSALRASIHATERALGAPGRWILALPTNHIAGFQVVARSVLADLPPVVVDTTRGFRPDALARAATRAVSRGDKDNNPTYLSLVPTQLVDVLAAEDPQVLESLRRVSAILIGGAASTPALLDRAANSGLNVLTTYGMTETCGGCVYNGLPLRGTEVVTVSDRVMISSTAMMEGYLDREPGTEFVSDGTRRWLRTGDCGHMEGPRLVVDGRIDDVINTGGVKVPSSAVRRVIAEIPEVAEVAVVSVPDERWGALVTAAIHPVADIDPRLIDPLREIAGLPPLAAAEPEPEKPVWPAPEAEAELPAIEMSPVEAAMAAMADKLRGVDVDVVEAAKTGRYIPPPEEDPETGEDADTSAPLDEDTSAQPAEQPEQDGDTEPAEEAPVEHLALKIRSVVSRELGRTHAPRAVVLLEFMPTTPSDDIDLEAVQMLAEHEVKAGRAWQR